MRTIKFRGKVNNPRGSDLLPHGSWVTGESYSRVKNIFDDGHLIFINGYEVDPETVGQLVYDKYFTGDIILIYCDCDSECGCSHHPETYELIWHKQYLQYGFSKGDKFLQLDEFGTENMRVVGNIYDNHEKLTPKYKRKE